MDTDKIKNFFTYHVEKMILVVVIGVSLFLIYNGMQKPNILNEHQPDRLAQEATQVKSAIDENHNEAIIPERIPQFDIVEETEELYTAVEPSAYKLDRTWEGKSVESVVRRQDPVLTAPRAIELTPVATAIAVRSQNTSTEPTYALASLEPAEPVEKVEQPKRTPRRSRRGRGMEEEMMMMEGGMEEEMMMMDMDMGYSEDMMGEMAGGTGTGGPVRKFSSEYDFGVRPVVGQDKRQPEPAVGHFIAGTAVVPHKELYSAFDMALRDAKGYDPRRDTPYYWGFEVQRADVTDKSVEELTDQDWTTIWDRLKYTKMAAYLWAGFAPEIVPEDYRDEALTMWIPPVLLDDYRPYVTHPLVPMVSKAELDRQEMLQEEPEEIQIFDPDDESTTLVGPGERSVGGGMMGEDMEMMEMDMGEYEMDGMMMGMMMGMGSRGIDADPVQYKLIRFYDFAGFRGSPKPGRQYVYRLRYSVVDPNFPFSSSLQPRVSNLSAEAANRVQDLMVEAEKQQSRAGLFERWSDWSEPSAPVSLPDLEHYYVGPVERARRVNLSVAGKQVPYERDNPKAKIVASQYDKSTGARIPLEMEVTEGSVLSKKVESADVVDPISLEVKKLPDAELVSGTTVIDIDGGLPLQITEDELKQPGVMLLWDQSGHLTVTDQVEDQEFYRIYSYAKEKGVQ